MSDPLSTSWLTSPAIAWLLTYALHSTLLLGLAWALSRPLAKRSPAAEEAVWKLALVGGLLTASLQLAAGWEPLGGRMTLAAAVTSEAVAVASPARTAASAPEIPPLAAAPEARGTQDLAFLSTAARQPIAVATPASPAPASRLPLALLGLWVAGAAALSARFLASYLSLTRRLRHRPQVVGGTVLGPLRRIAAAAGLPADLRLSCSSRLPVPIAMGVARPEVCVPPRALFELTSEQQEALLAHELGHLARRDPLWLLVSSALASVLFFQPLNWVARHRLHQLSELAADAWAVGQTGRPLSLARCLDQVAGWSLQPLTALPAPGMADRPSHLTQRIHRLLDGTVSPSRQPRWLPAGLAALLAVVVVAAPVVSAAQPPAPPPPPEAVAPPPPPAEPQDLPEMAPPSPEAPPPTPPADRAAHPPKAPKAPKPPRAPRPPHAPQEPAASVQLTPEQKARIDELQGRLAGLAAKHDKLTPEELDRISRDTAKIGAEIERILAPRMRDLEKRIAEQTAHLQDLKLPTEEMKRLEAEMQQVATRLSKLSETDLARLQAETAKLGEKEKLTAEERKKIAEDARRIAEKVRPSEADLKRLRELSVQHQALVHQAIDEHRAEIDAARQEIETETRALREVARSQVEDARRLRGADARPPLPPTAPTPPTGAAPPPPRAKRALPPPPPPSPGAAPRARIPAVPPPPAAAPSVGRPEAPTPPTDAPRAEAPEPSAPPAPAPPPPTPRGCEPLSPVAPLGAAGLILPFESAVQSLPEALGGWCLLRSSKPLSGAGCGVGGGFDSHALPPGGLLPRFLYSLL